MTGRGWARWLWFLQRRVQALQEVGLVAGEARGELPAAALVDELDQEMVPALAQLQAVGGSLATLGGANPDFLQDGLAIEPDLYGVVLRGL